MYASLRFSRRGAWALKEPAWKPSDYVAYLGVFQVPYNFSKEHARQATGASHPIGTQQYPAIFYVPKDVNDNVERRGVARTVTDSEADALLRTAPDEPAPRGARCQHHLRGERQDQG